ncbi:MAG: hypothetical protein AAFR77_13480, partial [Cyanobacteria bacterium J06631_2]
MQKPWSFKAIEFIIYIQIGLALIGISYAIFLFGIRFPNVLLEDSGGETFRELLISISDASSLMFYRLLGEPELAKLPASEFYAALRFFIQFFVSSVILYVLKTKSLFVIRITAILALVLRTA